MSWYSYLGDWNVYVHCLLADIDEDGVLSYMDGSVCVHGIMQAYL